MVSSPSSSKDISTAIPVTDSISTTSSTTPGTPSLFSADASAPTRMLSQTPSPLLLVAPGVRDLLSALSDRAPFFIAPAAPFLPLTPFLPPFFFLAHVTVNAPRADPTERRAATVGANPLQIRRGVDAPAVDGRTLKIPHPATDAMGPAIDAISHQPEPQRTETPHLHRGHAPGPVASDVAAVI